MTINEFPNGSLGSLVENVGEVKKKEEERHICEAYVHNKHKYIYL